MKIKIAHIALLAGIGLLHFPLTAVAQPVVTTLAATSIGQTNATINGTVNPNGDTAFAYFQYGPTPSFGYSGGFMTLPSTDVALTLPGLVLNELRGVAGATWTQTPAPTTNWASIASSADGTRLAAVVGGAGSNPGGIYTSTNAGVSWTQTSAPNEVWYSIASSTDGTHLAAVGYRAIYTSTNAGVTWTQASVSFQAWVSVASSANGTNLAAVVNGGGIFTSTNAGATWTQTSATNATWQSIASSADGMHLAAAATQNGIYTSANAGATWTKTSAPDYDWGSIACSADGQKLAAVAEYDIYISDDFGLSWTTPSVPFDGYYAVASSADGTRLATAAIQGGIYSSTNGGATWTQTSAPDAFWYSIASSADGSRLAAVANSESDIYVSSGTVSPLTLGITYYYQLVGMNTEGTNAGSTLTFVIPTTPAAITLAATGLGPTNATLNATVNPNGSATTVYFQYGSTTNYGTDTAIIELPATNIMLSVTNLITGLAPGTVYHFRIIAQNSLGLGIGGDMTFLPPAPPDVTTLPATDITSANATLNGTVNPLGALSVAYFEYGLTTNYDNLDEFIVLPATNDTLTLPALLVNALYGPAVTNWTQDLTSTNNWTSIASSADGTRLAATAPNAGIYISANSGVTWTQTSAPTNKDWISIASSANGSLLAAVASGGGIYASTNAGVTWDLTSAPVASWSSIASSVDGTLLAAVVTDGGIYTSTNAGVTWTLTSATTTTWQSIASSADGLRLAALAGGNSGFQGYVYTSTNAGVTWTQTSAPESFWISIASSADGLRLAAANDVGDIDTSPDGGITWTQTSAPVEEWTSIASSANGTHLTAAGYSYVYTSTNSGATWNLAGVPYEDWTSIASSAGGTRLALVSGSSTEFSGLIYSGTASTNNLLPGTTYHFRVVALNDSGTTLGDDLTFTTPAALPVVTTLAASNLTATSATLNGTINPGGGFTIAYFQYGLTTSYGSDSGDIMLSATNATLPVSGVITGLTPATTYHFQLEAINSAGANVGADMQFTTLPQAVNFDLTGAARTSGTTFQFSFTNLSGLSFTVLGATNLALPLTNWTVLGAPVESPAGKYQFTDPQATNTPRFYRVRSP